MQARVAPSRPALGVILAVTMGVACAPAAVPARSDADKVAALAEMVAEVRERYPEVEGVDASQVRELLRTNDAVLVDVRTNEEREVSAIPGAITSEEFQQDPSRYADRPVVAYCTVGERSARFARDMAKEGIPVLNFEGSLLAWTHNDGELVDSSGPTHTLHVYGPTWDLAANAYTTVW